MNLRTINIIHIPYSARPFWRIRLHSIMAAALWIIVLSPLIERIRAVGISELSHIRLFFSIVMLGSLYLVVTRWRRLVYPLFSLRSLPVIIFGGLLCLYVLSITIFFNGDLAKVTFYIIYVQFLVAGVVLYRSGGFPYFLKTLNMITFWAVAIGVLMYIVGPVFLDKTLGITVLRIGKSLNPSLFATKIESVEDIMVFRSFSLFVEHQAFASYMTLMSLLYRIIYSVQKERKYVLWCILLFLANFLTLSTTSAIGHLIILLSFLSVAKMMVVLSGIVGVCTVAAVYFWDIFILFFHAKSLQWRIIFLQRAISGISWSPKFLELEQRIIDSERFTSDCYIVYQTYKYGLIFGLLAILLLVAFLFLVKKRSLFMVTGLFVLLNVINLLTNGGYFSTPSNILLPLIAGLLVGINDDKAVNLKYV